MASGCIAVEPNRSTLDPDRGNPDEVVNAMAELILNDGFQQDVVSPLQEDKDWALCVSNLWYLRGVRFDELQDLYEGRREDVNYDPPWLSQHGDQLFRDFFSCESAVISEMVDKEMEDFDACDYIDCTELDLDD